MHANHAIVQPFEFLAVVHVRKASMRIPLLVSVHSVTCHVWNAMEVVIANVFPAKFQLFSHQALVNAQLVITPI